MIDNLAFPIEDFVTEDVAKIPLLFLCVEKKAEGVALYLLSKGADPTVKYEVRNHMLTIYGKLAW